MLSLKDEIKRFQNMVYNKQLAEFVTVDQMFVGGGITIQSMINQSNFIVQELKKMNEVFLNYCKLNQKVYNKIIEHELNLHNQQGRLNSLTSSLDRKINDMTKTVKQLHDNTLLQNQKSISLIQSVTLPLKLELQKKIDKITFEVQMKQILQDEGQPTYNNVQVGEEDKISTGSQGGLPGLNADGMPLVRKKGKVGYEEFYRLQAEISNRMKASDARLKQTTNDATEGKQLIVKYVPTINKNVFDINTHSSQIYKLNHGIEEQKNHLTAAADKLHLQINSKTNDQVWKNKLEGFYEKDLKPAFHVIQENIKNGQRQFKVYKETNNIKFNYIDEDFKDIKNRLGTAQNLLKKHTKDILKISEQVKLNHQQFYQEKVSNQKNMENLRYQTTKKFEGLQKSVNAEIEQLKRLINNLAKSIEESVLKAVIKKMQAQLKLIENDIRSNRQNTRNIKNDVNLICQQIKNVKDILSKKANFTDIIHQVERKADKEDFKNLQYKMNETSQQFISKNLNESISISRAERQRERQRDKPQRRASSLSRANKTLFAPRSATNRMNKTDLDVSTKLFMCGLEGQYGQKNILNLNSRRKSIKSSAAVISDFIL